MELYSKASNRGTHRALCWLSYVLCCKFNCTCMLSLLLYLPCSHTSCQHPGVEQTLHQGSAEGNIGQQPPGGGHQERHDTRSYRVTVSKMDSTCARGQNDIVYLARSYGIHWKPSPSFWIQRWLVWGRGKGLAINKNILWSSTITNGSLFYNFTCGMHDLKSSSIWDRITEESSLIRVTRNKYNRPLLIWSRGMLEMWLILFNAHLD